MSETELKFGGPERVTADVDRRLRQLGGRAQAIESHYWDSADRRLVESVLSLRLRKVDPSRPRCTVRRRRRGC